MNKKRLSVVMAGAMLASSVAPVLAEEGTSTEVSAAQKGELINSLTGKIWAAERFSAKDKVMPGWSVYGIQINDGEVKGFSKSHKVEGSESALQEEIKTYLNSKNLRVGDIVKLVNLGTDKRGDELYSQYISTKYTESEITNPIGEDNSIEDQLKEVAKYKGFTDIVDVDNSGYSLKDKAYIIKFTTAYVNYLKNPTTPAENKPYGVVEELKLDTTSERIDLRHYYKTAEQSTTEDFAAGAPANNDAFFGFVKVSKDLDVAATVLESTELLSGGDTYKTSDLYDGLFLTTKGYELLNAAKETESILAKSNTVANHSLTDYIVKVDDDETSHEVTNKNGNDYEVKVEIANPIKVAKAIENGTDPDKTWAHNDTDYDTYYIKGSSKTELETLVKWLDNRDAAVDKIEGEDRYATAVRIAKEVNIVGRKASDIKQKTKDIVLVNGSALVDGLAAAPLAGSLTTADTKAPILLTAKNELPKVTQRYLRELIDLEGNKDITVHIVGGEGVVSNNVKKQLRSLGLNVERYAGEDREETSMAVAKEIGFENGAFVIGAEGEADAMSVSGLAAANKAPVVVSGFNGLSEDTIDALDGVRVNVIGGDSRVSKADYEEVAAVAESIRRVEGSDRKATNAAVIDTFYKNSFREAESVIVTRDDELVDALASANLASIEGAPIVLGTKSLSKDQINAVVANAKKADKVYQIGGLVERNVVKVVAEALNLVNNEK